MLCSISAGIAVAVLAVLITASPPSLTKLSPIDHLPELPPPLAPTLITDCPLYHVSDPESPDGPCICDVTMCPEPDCPPTNIPIALPSTASTCCPTYQCVSCSDAELQAMQCRCATTTHSVDNGSYVDEMGTCGCVDAEETWDWNVGCQCDVDKCRLPDLCLGNSVEVRVLDGCCERVECVECPEDSVAQLADDGSEIEAKCVCRVCPDKVCSENELTVIRKPGRSIPNHCCDLYDCIEKGCSINGTKYDEGDQWIIEKDTQCRCQTGIALCNKPPLKTQKENDLKNCFYHGNSYRDGEVWSVDQCTNCTCHGGQPKCIAHLCMQFTETVVTHPTTDRCLLVLCDLQCAEYDRDVHGCQMCECKEDSSVKIEIPSDSRQKTDMVVIIVLIIAALLVIVMIAAFFTLRKKCKRMRYYPETKHNLLLDNNNTSRDIYISTTKTEDQITLPLYKATTIENTRN